MKIGFLIYTSLFLYITPYAQRQELKKGNLKIQSRGMSADYSGQVLNDRANGRGSATFENGDSYEGWWVENRPSMQGKMHFADGSVYDGDWDKGVPSGKGTFNAKESEGYVYKGNVLNGKWHGQGKMTLKGGSSFDGFWSMGEQSGKCIWISVEEGFRYEGYVLKGVRHGKGTLRMKDSSIFSGDWVNGLQTGICNNKSATGIRYEGQITKDIIEGKGKMTFPTGEIYDGFFKAGTYHGKGKWINKDGSVFDGDWINGKQNGIGILYFANDDRYEGEWTNGEFNGNGSFFFANGAIYHGEFRKNKRHGYGQLLEADGFIYQGLFDSSNNGDLIRGTIWAPDGMEYTGYLKQTGNAHLPSGYGKKIESNGVVLEGKWVNGTLTEKMTRVVYDKTYGKTELPVLPQWILDKHLIDSTDYTAREYLFKKGLTKTDLYNAAGKKAIEYKAQKLPIKRMHQYLLDDSTGNLLLGSATGMKYKFSFTNSEALIRAYTKKEAGNNKWIEIPQPIIFLKIPSGNIKQEWKINFENTNYLCTSENTTIKIGSTARECILLTQTTNGFSRKYYFQKGVGLLRVEDGDGKLIAAVK